MKSVLPLLDAFRTVDWKKIAIEIGEMGFV
jgi:hypothetical protein